MALPTEAVPKRYEMQYQISNHTRFFVFIFFFRKIVFFNFISQRAY